MAHIEEIAMPTVEQLAGPAVFDERVGGSHNLDVAVEQYVLHACGMTKDTGLDPAIRFRVAVDCRDFVEHIIAA